MDYIPFSESHSGIFEEVHVYRNLYNACLVPFPCKRLNRVQISLGVEFNTLVSLYFEDVFSIVSISSTLQKHSILIPYETSCPINIDLSFKYFIKDRLSIVHGFYETHVEIFLRKYTG